MRVERRSKRTRRRACEADMGVKSIDSRRTTSSGKRSERDATFLIRAACRQLNVLIRSTKGCTYPIDVRPRLTPLLTGEENESRISLRKVVTVSLSTLQVLNAASTSLANR